MAIDQLQDVSVIDAISGVIDDVNTDITPVILNFYHGTPMEFTREHGIDMDGNQLKYPAVFMWEPFTEALNLNEGVNEYSTSSIRLIFLDSVKPAEWSVANYYANRMDQLKEYTLLFLQKLDLKAGIKLDLTEEIDRITHTNWGVVVVNRGHVQSIIDEAVGGIELNNVAVVIDKSYICN